MSRRDVESNENVYENFDMSAIAKGIVCGTVERVKHGTLRWFGHVMRVS